MSRYFTFLVSFGLLAPHLGAEGAVECTEKETLLRPLSNRVTKITDCLMECTGMTYIRKLQLQDRHNIRLKDSTEGKETHSVIERCAESNAAHIISHQSPSLSTEDLGEYCWSTDLKCTIGESFHRAYVVLPVDVFAVAPEQLDVRVTAPAATTLRAHSGSSTVADACGLRYDVTEHFSAATAGTSFCVRVIAPEDVLGDRVLKCSPYLVTFWQRNPS